jgi:tripartite-type tricarboxylate transporter receptor subunit TctC
MSKTPTWQKLLEENLLEGAYLNANDTMAFLRENENTMREVITMAGIKLVR